MLRGLSLRIWMPFTLVLALIAVAFNLYYPKKQELFYVQNKNNELKELAKTVGLGVELSLSEDNFEGLRKTLDFASERKDFEFIAIIVEEDNKQRVFSSYPVLKESSILKKSSDLFYQKSRFNSDIFNGYILIAASKKKMSTELAELNRPVLYTTAVIFLVTFFIYLLIAKRITKPLNKLLGITQSMGLEEINPLPPIVVKKDEIGLLTASIYELHHKLIEQRIRNKELYDGLEEEVKNRTKELAEVTQDLIESQKVALLGNYKINLTKEIIFLPELFFEFLGIDYEHKFDINRLKQITIIEDKVIWDEILFETELNSIFEKEIRFLDNKGNYVWILFSGSKNIEPLSSDIILKGLIQNITERKKYEIEINQLSLVAKNTSNCVIITDAERKIIWVNESTLKITEYSLDEILGKSPKMFQFEKTNPQTLDYIKQKLDNRESINCEILNRSKGGREYWLELNIVPLLNERGILYGYIAVETDITDIKHSALELELREKQLRDILDNSAEMIHTLDEYGNVLWANRSWKENLNVSDTDLKEKNILEFLDTKTKLEFEEIMPRLAQGEKVGNLDCGFYSTKNEKLLLKGQAIPLFHEGRFIGSQAYLHNVTQIVKAEQELHSFSLMQKLLMEVSFEFLTAEPLESEDVLNSATLKIGNYLNANKIILTMINEKSILNRNLVIKSSLGEINLQEAEARVGSISKYRYATPLLRNNEKVGELALEFEFEKSLTSNENELVGLFTALLINVENRYNSAREINDAKREIETINSTLENKVLENTKRNLDLSKTIVEQEKMATIGELSAGIAHDLNTPLGAIKAGTESISYSLDNIFAMLNNLNRNELELLYNIAKSRKIDVFVGGLQLHRDIKELSEFLSTLGVEKMEIPILSELLAKCRIGINETELILEIIKSDQPKRFLELLQNLATTYSMISSVNDSVNKASEVVQNMRSFIRKDVSSGLNRQEINIKENVKVVLNIFSYEFKNNTSLHLDIDDDITVLGFSVKLFQLWTNLIKNALDAMEAQSEKKIIIIGKQESGKVYVSIANNGPMIPKEIQDNIFKKFYSTKKERNGTGLGLSIVQSVLHEHNASITLESNEELTTFMIEFRKL